MWNLIWCGFCFVIVAVCMYQNYQTKHFGLACFNAGCLGFFLNYMLYKAFEVFGG